MNDALNTLFLAIQDLIKYDKNIDLAFGFCNVRMINRKLNVVFRDDLNSTIGSAKFEDSMAR